MITAERTMVKPTAYTEDVEMKWTQSDQEAVEATYSQESAVAGSTEYGRRSSGACGQEPAQTCGQNDSSSGRRASAGSTRSRWTPGAPSWPLPPLSPRASTASSRSGAASPCTEYEILVRLSERPSRRCVCPPLAEHVSHSRSRLTHTVRRLENVGYVERSSCDSDRRGVNCTLTQVASTSCVRPRRFISTACAATSSDRLSREQQVALAELMKAVAQAPESSCGASAASASSPS